MLNYGLDTYDEGTAKLSNVLEWQMEAAVSLCGAEHL